ncbi:MAG TPA: GNAT family N-acetyltransferase [Caulobacteraceae bacterium]|jgi:ribosomal protein S18 acetylase RimI-like enzyme
MESDFGLRPAFAADTPLIAGIDEACGAPQDVHRAGLVPELLNYGLSWIAEADGVAAGYALVSRRFFSRRFVELLAVAPAFRRQGLGVALMARCEAAGEGEVLFTSTNQSNVAMQALLAKARYEPSGVIYNLDPGDPELVFAKLTPQA